MKSKIKTFLYGDIEGQRKELADAIGCKPENVIMFEYAGSYSTPIYSKVNF